MWEIKPVEIKISFKDKQAPERIAENAIAKIGLDPCYLIIHQEGVLGESVHEFLKIINNYDNSRISE